MEIEDIKHLAHLARIRVTEDEAETLQRDIESVLDYVSAVNEITAGSDVTKKVGAVHNVMREDVVTNEPASCSEALLNEMPERSGDLLKVKKILSND